MVGVGLAESSSALGWSEIKLGPRDFSALSAFIQKEVGIQIPPAKRVMLESRLRRRLRALGLKDFHTYTTRVLGPPRDQEEIVNLIDAVTTNKTDFFREPHHFTYLERHVLPQLIDAGVGGPRQPVTVWSAASSTGEEAYTLAMVLNEFAERHGIDWRITATDISTAVLARAQRAVYDSDSVAPIPVALKAKYLLRSRDQSKGLVRIVPGLRHKVTFRRLNLLDRHYDIPRPVDVIFCRNVFIYLNRATQEQILLRFVDCLRPGGFVFLGHSETVNGLSVPLAQIAPTIYRRIRR